RSEEIITKKTFEVCFNLARDLSTIAREELLLNSTYEGISGVIQKLRVTKEESLLSIYVINKYGVYVADLDSKLKGKKVKENEINYLKTVNKPQISKKQFSEIKNIIRFEFPVYLEGEEFDSLKLGFVIFEYDEKLLYETVYRFKRNLIILSIGYFVFIIIISLIISKIFTKNIRKLSEGVKVIGSGNLDLKLDINTSDEIGDLAKNFNEMTDRLKEAGKFKEALLNSYSKFVPIEFLNYLEKESILEIKLGDQIEIDMAILFSDIRSFTTLSEQLSAEDTFKFINSYLAAMVPQIIQNNGFIDKYIGDAIMALFRSPEKAIDAGIDMLEELYQYNKKREDFLEKNISIGVGIHTGKLILGIVGSDLRIQGTVISDAVNLASRLEGLTKMYGASLLVSEETLNRVPDKSKYQHRIIDRVKVKGKETAVDVVEILNGNSQRIIDLKLSTSGLMKEGLYYFREAKFEKAVSIFETIIEKDPLDKTAKIHLQRSIYYKEHGAPPDWEGISRMNEK
ncbi:MAG: adenylate/guanylate cyclase domain-containing protein, partial [Leptospiraceae bacterium]|nr:adenylate/guanylate cyclase domain-containing protein [Leptospiraceae bacterium]